MSKFTPDDSTHEALPQSDRLLPSDRLKQLCSHLAGEGSIDEGAFEWHEVDAIMGKVNRSSVYQRRSGLAGDQASGAESTVFNHGLSVSVSDRM